MVRVKVKADYIYPYGRGFIFYTDKEWKHGIVEINEKYITVYGTSETVRIPLLYIVSVDRKVTLPPLREGRAFFLVEHYCYKIKDKLYLLISGYEENVRLLKKALLCNLTNNVTILYRTEKDWKKGYMAVENNNIVFKPEGLEIKPHTIVKVERRAVTFGLNKVGTIYIEYKTNDEVREIYLLINPAKRDFFWKLINLVIDEHLNKYVISQLTGEERMILYMVKAGASVQEILDKLHITPNEFRKMMDKLEDLGLIKRIIILQLTDRGRKVVDFIPESS